MKSQNPTRAQVQAVEPSLVGDFSLRYLLEVVFRRKRVLLLTFVVTPVLAILMGFLVRPVYMSTTTILLGKNEILNPLVNFDMAVSMTDQNRLGSFQKVIGSRPLIDSAIHTQQLDRAIHTDVEMEQKVEDIRVNTHLIELSADSFQIGYTASDPVQAKNMVETLTRLFIARSLFANRREATAAVDFLQKEVEHYQSELKRLDNQLQTFRTANRETLNATSKPGTGESLHEAIATATFDLQEMQAFEQLYRDRLSGVKPLVSSTPQMFQSSPFQAHYQALQAEMGNLLATRTESHPEVLKKQREMEYILTLLNREKEEKEKAAKDTTEIRSPVYLETLARLDDSLIRSKTLALKIDELKRQQEAFLQNLAKTPELVQEELRMVDEC